MARITFDILKLSRYMPLVLLLMSLISTWSPQTPDLKHFQWKNRILLLFAPTTADERLKKQTDQIEANRAGFDERDLLTFIIPEQSPLRAQFHVNNKAYIVILLGKDGTEKLRQESVVDPEKLFRLIDSMPMRRAESATIKRP
jgi:hypothetical protein